METPSKEITWPKEENVGVNFSFEKAIFAREKAWKILFEIASEICEGMDETAGQAVASRIFASHGISQTWHPSKIRFAANTRKAFREISATDLVLAKGDLFFLDIGPVIDGYEADVGKTFVVGHKVISEVPFSKDNSAAEEKMNLKFTPEEKLQMTSEEIFAATAKHWRERHSSGAELYQFANQMAETKGYFLTLDGASGHRISDFPHAIHYRGKLKDFNHEAHSLRWVLEIQIHDPKLNRAAFFEDILI